MKPLLFILTRLSYNYHEHVHDPSDEVLMCSYYICVCVCVSARQLETYPSAFCMVVT